MRRMRRNKATRKQFARCAIDFMMATDNGTVAGIKGMADVGGRMMLSAFVLVITTVVITSILSKSISEEGLCLISVALVLLTLTGMLVSGIRFIYTSLLKRYKRLPFERQDILDEIAGEIALLWELRRENGEGLVRSELASAEALFLERWNEPTAYEREQALYEEKRREAADVEDAIRRGGVEAATEFQLESIREHLSRASQRRDPETEAAEAAYRELHPELDPALAEPAVATETEQPAELPHLIT